MARRSSSKISAASSDKPQSGQRAKSDPPESKFELIAELGRGGMATVYLARAKKRPDRLLVLKQLRSDLAEHAEFLAMFLEEARLAGKLQHPNIVETYEVGQDAGICYIAMEYLEGLSLQAVLTKFGWRGEFTFPLQVFTLIEALKGLEQAYTQRDDDGTPLKIVHRDVSPPNIIITFDGQVKLVDFGIAKAANSHVETRTGLIKGKLTYMAPEQAQSGDVDSRTDIYSVGVMLWQAAAGTRRWKGIENTEVLKRLHSGDVVDLPNAKKSMLPTIVDDIVVKAIDADPEKRHRSASAFRVTLESLLREMKADVASKDLGVFMQKHFGDARARAAAVMKQRVMELDASATNTKQQLESVTAIRVAPSESPRAGAKSEAESRTRASERAQVGGAAAGLAERLIKPAAPPMKPRRAEGQAQSHRNYAIGIAIVGIGCAAALLGFAHHLRVHSLPPQPPTPSATFMAIASAAPPMMTTTSGTPVGLGGTALPTENTTPPVTSAPPISTTDQAPREPRRHRGHATSPANQSPKVTEPAPIPIMTSAPPPSSSSPSEANAPALDKQDPWTTSRPRTDKSDPWADQAPPAR